jgi:hypothetical protein
MQLYSDLKELSAWIIGLCCLISMVVIVYRKPTNGKEKAGN